MYTHWSGSSVQKVVKNALVRGNDRWVIRNTGLREDVRRKASLRIRVGRQRRRGRAGAQEESEKAGAKKKTKQESTASRRRSGGTARAIGEWVLLRRHWALSGWAIATSGARLVLRQAGCFGRS
jgi:hypothetical protein